MATRILVEDMIAHFCELFGKQKNEKMVDAWVDALNRYRDNEIAQAGHKAMEECQRMPTPLDVIQRIPVNQTFENVDYRIVSGKCSKCGRYGMAITEPIGSPYLCRECYTGLTGKEIGSRLHKLGEWTDHARI